MDAINYSYPNPHILLISIIKEALVVRLYHEVDVMLCSYMIMWLFSIIVSIHNLLYMNYNIGMGAMGLSFKNYGEKNCYQCHKNLQKQFWCDRCVVILHRLKPVLVLFK